MPSGTTLPIAMAAGLHLIDGLVVALYLMGITVMGVWMGRRLSGREDFFMPRKFGKGMMMMHAFGTGTASDQAVTVSSATFRTGLSGIWYQWLWLFVTPFYLLTFRYRNASEVKSEVSRAFMLPPFSL